MGLILGYDRTMKRELQGHYVIMQKCKGVKKGTKIGQPVYIVEESRYLKSHSYLKYASYQGIFTC
jgi:hypothetical protein